MQPESSASCRSAGAGGGPDEDPLAPLAESLDKGEILIFFSGRDPGRAGATQGIQERYRPAQGTAARSAGVPVFLHGLGKALPKGEAILVPFFVDVFVGEPVAWTGERESYMTAFREAIVNLADEGDLPAWD